MRFGPVRRRAEDPRSGTRFRRRPNRAPALAEARPTDSRTATGPLQGPGRQRRQRRGMTTSNEHSRRPSGRGERSDGCRASSPPPPRNGPALWVHKRGVLRLPQGFRSTCPEVPRSRLTTPSHHGTPRMSSETPTTDHNVRYAPSLHRRPGVQRAKRVASRAWPPFPAPRRPARPRRPLLPPAPGASPSRGHLAAPRR